MSRFVDYDPLNLCEFDVSHQPWTAKQKRIFILFLVLRFGKIYINRMARARHFIFETMSMYIQTRNPSQCRIFFQKKIHDKRSYMTIDQFLIRQCYSGPRNLHEETQQLRKEIYQLLEELKDKVLGPKTVTMNRTRANKNLKRLKALATDYFTMKEKKRKQNKQKYGDEYEEPDDQNFHDLSDSQPEHETEGGDMIRLSMSQKAYDARPFFTAKNAKKHEHDRHRQSIFQNVAAARANYCLKRALNTKTHHQFRSKLKKGLRALRCNNYKRMVEKKKKILKNPYLKYLRNTKPKIEEEHVMLQDQQKQVNNYMEEQNQQDPGFNQNQSKSLFRNYINVKNMAQIKLEQIENEKMIMNPLMTCGHDDRLYVTNQLCVSCFLFKHKEQKQANLVCEHEGSPYGLDNLCLNCYIQESAQRGLYKVQHTQGAKKLASSEFIPSKYGYQEYSNQQYLENEFQADQKFSKMIVIMFEEKIKNAIEELIESKKYKDRELMKNKDLWVEQINRIYEKKQKL